MSQETTIDEMFERIYSIDLVYLKDCWKLCEGHCCGFEKHKRRFRLLGQQHSNELYLLPGEYEFLEGKNWLGQFGDFDHRVQEVALGGDVLRVETIVSREPLCPCEHDTRPTVCRLYPLLPVFSVAGKLVATEKTSIFDEMEEIEGISPICEVRVVPFPELNKYLAIAGELSRHPVQLFYLEAYRLTKRHVARKLGEARRATATSAFSLFEKGFISGTLIDRSVLDEELLALRNRFEQHYGAAFQLEQQGLS